MKHLQTYLKLWAGHEQKLVLKEEAEIEFGVNLSDESPSLIFPNGGPGEKPHEKYSICHLFEWNMIILDICIFAFGMQSSII